MTVTIENLYTGNGSTTDYSFTFPYLDTTDIKASLGGIATTAYSLLNATTVRFDSAPGNGVAIRIYRDTAFETPKATFYPGSAIRANDLNDNTLQNLYVNHESNWKVDRAWITGDPTVISTESWYTTDDTKIATTKATENRISAKIDTAIEGDILAGTDLAKTASGGQVTINHSVGGANTTVNNSDGNVIQDITITAQGHVTAVGSKNLNDVYYTEAELDAGQLDNRYYTEAEADARFYNLASAEEIQSGETWVAADDKVATTSAIDARIVDLVDDVGGFVPIANETSFPNANPDVNNGAGTLVSIKALSNNLTSNGSGVATIANGTVGNSTVTINGLENSTTYGATLGMIVETTSTLNTYTFHRVTPKATEVTTVASNIASVNTTATNITNVNTFANVYRIASSAPGSNNDDGDLYYNTSDNKLYVYNGSAWEVAASLNGSGGTVTGDITFSDNTKLELGTGNDLQIYHNGSSHDSYIDNTNASGHLYIRNTGIESNIYIEARSGETSIECKDDNSVDIYYNGQKRLETTSTGTLTSGTKAEISATGASDEPMFKVTSENGQIFLRAAGSSGSFPTGGGGDDAELLYIGGDFRVGIGSASKNLIFINGGSYNERARFNSSGSFKLPDSAKIELGGAQTGSGDLQIYHDGTDSYIKNNAGDLILRDDTIKLKAYSTTDTYLEANNGGAVSLRYDNSVKLETNAEGVKISGFLEMEDNQRIQMGTGDDLQIYHDGSHSFIKDTGTGNLAICGSIVALHASDATESMILCSENGAVQLYYDNSKKLETYSSGVQVTGTFYIPDGSSSDNRISLGSGGDLKIWHSGTHSYINHSNAGNLYIMPTTGDVVFDNGSGELARITQGGDIKLPDNGELRFGAGEDLKIYHDGSHSRIKDDGTGYLILNTDSGVLIKNGADDEGIAYFTPNGAVELMYDNSKKFETTSTGVTFGDNWLYANDNAQIRLGNGADLQIYHDGTHSYINNTTNDLKITDTGGGGIIIGANSLDLRTSAHDEKYFSGNVNAAVKLYYDGTVKFETKSGGVGISGHTYQGDNEKAKFGASDDLEIYHNGTENVIDSNAGNLDIIAANDVKAIRVHTDGTVDIGYQTDDIKLRFGAGSDLQIYHTGTNSYVANSTGLLQLKNTAGNIDSLAWNDVLLRVNAGEMAVDCNANGAVELYYDNSKKFETTSTGAKITSSGSSHGLKVYHSNGNEVASLIHGGSGDEGQIILKDSGTNTVVIRGENGTDIEITTGGNFDLEHDSARLRLGADNDLRIYHNGSNAYMDNYTGAFYIRNDGSNDDNHIHIQARNAEESIICLDDSAVELYYDGSKKFETTSTGVKMTGTYLNTVSGSSSGGLHAQSNGCEAFVWAIQNAGNLINGSTAGRMGIRGTSGIDFSGNNGSSLEMSLASGDLTVHNGSVSDSKGDLRTVILNINSSAYTLVAGDAGKCVTNTTGGWTVNNNVFTAGQVVTFINNSGSAQTITQGSGVTIYNTADAATGNRTLAARGMATLIFYNASSGYISGAGLT